MPIIPSGYAQVLHVLRQAQDPEPMTIQYGLDMGAPPSEALAQQLQFIFSSEMKGVIGSSYTLEGTVLQNENVSYEDFTNPVAGEDNAASLPQNCAYLIRKTTGLRGRSNQGRMYLPGVSEGNVNNDGTLVSGQIGAVQGSLNDWFDGIVAETEYNAVVILHGSESFGAPTPVLSFDIDPVIATQRRRLR